jgi:hypothetical protein
MRVGEYQVRVALGVYYLDLFAHLDFYGYSRVLAFCVLFEFWAQVCCAFVGVY